MTRQRTARTTEDGWTLFEDGPRLISRSRGREWAYWVDGRWVPHDDYWRPVWQETHARLAAERGA